MSKATRCALAGAGLALGIGIEFCANKAGDHLAVVVIGSITWMFYCWIEATR